MNNFSDQEYKILKTDTAEIRNSISRYIGYIISVTGVSGFIKFYFDKEIGKDGTLTLFFVSMAVLTLLFEVVWYKFKSHNRMVGYMQLLMQEIDAIPYKIIKDKDHWKEKKYIHKWREYKREKGDKGIKDFFTWEFVMSRLNSNLINKYSDSEKNIKAYTDALDKRKYIFSLPEELIPFTKVLDCRDDKGNVIDRDVDFFSKIILQIHLKNNSKWLLSWPPFKYLRFLYSSKFNRSKLDKIEVEKAYLVYGWSFPRKITQIAFSAIFLIYLFFIYFVFNNYLDLNLKDVFNLKLVLRKLYLFFDLLLPVLLLVLCSSIILFWMVRYVMKLKELIYGKYSIDFYCWEFFIYRIQMLNSKALVPVYYSRAYLRYFKSKLYYEVSETNKINIKNIIGSSAEKLFSSYQENLLKHKDFSKNYSMKLFHSCLVSAFKQMQKKKNYKSNYEIDESVLRICFEEFIELKK